MFYIKTEMEKLPVVKFAHSFITTDYSFNNGSMNSFEIAYIDKGVWSVDIKGYMSYDANPGDIIVIPPDVTFSTHIQPGGDIHEHSCINFVLDSEYEILSHADFISYMYLFDTYEYNISDDQVILPFRVAGTSAYENHIKTVISEMTYMKAGYQLNAAGRLTTLLSLITRDTIELLRQEGKRLKVPPMNHVYCKKILDYIDAHYNEKVAINALADINGLNASYMCNLFKRTTGDTIISYLNHVRVEKSKELLAMTNHNIKDICGLLGFDNEHYFCRVFKKYEGIPPGKYRSVNINNLKIQIKIQPGNIIYL